MADGFVLRRLLSTDNLKTLSAGDEKYLALKTFAVRNARKYEDERLARTYVWEDDENKRLAAYLTMVCSEVTSDLESPPVVADGLNFPYRHWPAVKISRLLVDSRYRRDGALWRNDLRLGEKLVQMAIGVSFLQVCPAVGCRFVVVDAKTDAVTFYKKLGFILLDTAANKERPDPVMFMDLHKLDA